VSGKDIVRGYLVPVVESSVGWRGRRSISHRAVAVSVAVSVGEAVSVAEAGAVSEAGADAEPDPEPDVGADAEAGAEADTEADLEAILEANLREDLRDLGRGGSGFPSSEASKSPYRTVRLRNRI
jgi:hypothetical protein